ncbi:MAG: hypothetical protein ACO1SV_18355 [Fimbriimonas sp.]
MRALLLILSIVLGHVHACHTIWRLPDGQVCATCPQTDDCDGEAKGHRERVTVASADCRDCCSLTHCDDEGPDLPSAYTFAAPLVMARIEPVLVLPSAPVLTHDPISAVVALHRPLAPPSNPSTRAPPPLLS